MAISDLKDQLMRVEYLENQEAVDQTYLVQIRKTLEWYYYFEISVSTGDQEMEVVMFLRNNTEATLDPNTSLYFYADPSDTVIATFDYNPFVTETPLTITTSILVNSQFPTYQEAIAVLRSLYGQRSKIAELGYLTESQYNAYPGCWFYDANPLEFELGDIENEFDNEGGGSGGGGGGSEEGGGGGEEGGGGGEVST